MSAGAGASTRPRADEVERVVARPALRCAYFLGLAFAAGFAAAALRFVAVFGAVAAGLAALLAAALPGFASLLDVLSAFAAGFAAFLAAAGAAFFAVLAGLLAVFDAAGFAGLPGFAVVTTDSFGDLLAAFGAVTVDLTALDALIGATAASFAAFGLPATSPTAGAAFFVVAFAVAFRAISIVPSYARPIAVHNP